MISWADASYNFIDIHYWTQEMYQHEDNKLLSMSFVQNVDGIIVHNPIRYKKDKNG